MKRRWQRIGMLLAGVLVAAGCGGVEPPDYTTVEDEAAYAATRDGVDEAFSRAVETATEATSGGELREGGRVRSLRCDTLYPDEFREFEIGGSFLVPESTADVVVEQILAAWEAEGWDARVTSEDRVSMEDEVGDGVRVVGAARVQDVSDGAVAVSINFGTGCLKVPDGAWRNDPDPPEA